MQGEELESEEERETEKEEGSTGGRTSSAAIVLNMLLYTSITAAIFFRTPFNRSQEDRDEILKEGMIQMRGSIKNLPLTPTNLQKSAPRDAQETIRHWISENGSQKNQTKKVEDEEEEDRDGSNQEP